MDRLIVVKSLLVLLLLTCVVGEASSQPIRSSGQALPSASAEALQSPVYALWNGFLNMTNILELVNTGRGELNATVTMYDIQGNSTVPLAISIGPRGQYDLILNGLPAFLADSYGIIKIEFGGEALSGRVSFYRSTPAGKSGDDYEFAF